ncbi:MAG: lysostaphin resistance A-like protein [Planctomycetota bacterium]
MNQTLGSSADPAPAPAPEQFGWRRDGPRFVLVAWVIATGVLAATAIGAAILVSLFATVRAALGGERSGERLGEIAQEALGGPAIAWTALIASQLALLACAWLACRILRKPAHERLGLVATGLRPVQRAVVLVATVVPFALGLVAAGLVERALGSSSDDTLGLQRMWSEGSRGGSAAWILLIALLPGFVEEVFYRGFLQRGLLLRFGPSASILTSSVLFALVHGELAWATAIFPLGVWLGVVAWRTGSVLLTFAAHAGVNGLWTAGMMILHRDPASESTMNWIAIAVLALGVIAFPWAIVILRREPAVAPSAVTRRPLWLLPRVAGTAVVAGALSFVLVPPGAAPMVPVQVATPSAPTLGELEASALAAVTCTAAGDAGAVEFTLMPGVGARVALPKNRVGIDEVIVTLDAAGETVWLAYAGERSGKRGKGRPVGIVEQLASGDPTVLCMTLTPGPPPVSVRLTLEEDEAMKLAAFERADAEGWAKRGRK